MTRTTAANAPALPVATASFDRRSFLATLASAGVMTAGDAIAATPHGAVDHPDAKLLDLIAKHEFHTAQRREFDRLTDEACERFEAPPIPTALYWRKRDFLSVCFDRSRLAVYLIGGREVHVYERENLRGLPSLVATIKANPAGFPGRQYEIERTAELFDAMEEWEAATRRAEDDAGVTEPSLRADRECLILRGLTRGVASTPARTIEGLLAKARVAASIYLGPAEAIRDRILRHLDGDHERDAIGLSMIADALDLQKPSSATVAA